MNPWRKFWKSLGPGLVSGASDDDPSGIVTYSLAGAMFGLGTLWTTLVSIPLVTAVQEACARLGAVTHKGLVQNLRKKVPAPVLWVGVLLFVAATAFNLGADIKIMAASAQVFIDWPMWIWFTIFSVACLLLQVFVDYGLYTRILKWLCLSLFAYVAVAFIVHVPWFYAFVATFSPPLQFHHGYWLAALFGSAFSPYLCVWQTTQEVETEKYEGCLDAGCRDRHVCDMNEILYCRRMDVAVGTTLSNVMAWFIILTAGTVLYANGIHNIEMPGQAAAVLAPLAGPFATQLFALGIIGTGLLAVPVLSGTAAYAIVEMLGIRKFGFSYTVREAPAFYVAIAAVILLGVTMMLFGLPTIQALVYAAIANAFVSPFMLLGIIHVTRDPKIMGLNVNGRVSTVLLWGTMALICFSLGFWLIFG
jgi:Mn2+/Fe2+ NRAMP family transporter